MILAVCFILGIFFQDYFLLGKRLIYGVASINMGILISIFFNTYFLYKTRAILLGILFFGIGLLLHFFNSSSPKGDISVNKNETIILKISQKLNSTEKYKKYEGIAQLGKNSFNSIIYIPKSHDELDYKNYYKTEAYITKPQKPQYDFQFNYAQYLKRKNIDYQIYISKDFSIVERNDLSFTEQIRQYRFNVLKKIDKTVMSGPTKAFLKGIILADRTEMDMGTVQDFNRSGLVHLLAISGTHIVIIFGLFYFVMVRCIPLKFNKYSIVLSLMFIWLFALFIGFGNSVLRSCIMLNVYFIFVLLQRKPDLLHSLALSAFIILILDTQQLFDVGFQLSFLAVLGIFWLNQPLLKYFPRADNYFKKLIFNTITISLSAQLATLPLVLYYFHQFSFVSIVANVFIVPFSEVIIVFSFLMTFLIAFGLNFSFMDKLYDGIIQILLKVIHWFAEADMVLFKSIPMNLIEVISISIAIYFLRALILKINFKNSMNFVIAVLAFLMTRIGCNIVGNQKEEVLLHSFSKSKIISIKKGNKVCFWIPDRVGREKVLQYIIEPYCSSRRIDQFEIKQIPFSTKKIVFGDHVYDMK
ncbi:ComEC/Rec2 family competence protein [Chryseobacterium jejuense]|uniref:ComEC family competence protein n=1 Tax=Chryseobacterium jejuense TaxID=445960 RepID=A0A2X2XE37_CHRJE|nr:ComEC/Rec2 family competence protein [Chryseobacterium jejuense]SDJ53252.1 competence protein ComEC [Chryseobacterium jejuense]SQB46295.1 ComEC family competence protein [Chryseobacterium jejuense]